MNRAFIIFTIAYWGIIEVIAVTSGREANRLMTDPMAHGINPAGASALYQLRSHLNLYAIALPAFLAILLVRFAHLRFIQRQRMLDSEVDTPSE